MRVLWHPKINQVSSLPTSHSTYSKLTAPLQIVTGSADGSIHVLYSPTSSTNGAKLCVGRAPKRRQLEDLQNDVNNIGPIITPHALPMFKDDNGMSNKRKREKERADPVKSKRPELPMVGQGKGGRIGASATVHTVQRLFRNSVRDEDVSLCCFPLYTTWDEVTDTLCCLSSHEKRCTSTPLSLVQILYGLEVSHIIYALIWVVLC